MSDEASACSRGPLNAPERDRDLFITQYLDEQRLLRDELVPSTEFQCREYVILCGLMVA